MMSQTRACAVRFLRDPVKAALHAELLDERGDVAPMIEVPPRQPLGSALLPWVSIHPADTVPGHSSLSRYARNSITEQPDTAACHAAFLASASGTCWRLGLQHGGIELLGRAEGTVGAAASCLRSTM